MLEELRELVDVMIGAKAGLCKECGTSVRLHARSVSQSVVSGGPGRHGRPRQGEEAQLANGGKR